MPLFQRLDSKKRLSAREQDARRRRDRESCEIEGHTFFCRCKKFPGTRTKFPRHTHTPCSSTHHPSRNKQVRPTSTARARSPQDTKHSSSISRLCIPAGISRVNLGVGECARPLLTCAGGWCCTLVLPHLRHSSVSRCPSPKHKGLGLFDNVILRGEAPFKRALTYSRTADSSVLVISTTLCSVLELDKRVSGI